MENSTENRNSIFLIQGSILAIASIISRVIGLFYRLPMTNIIGDMGNNYYSAAFDIYNMTLILTSYCLPTAVSRMVAARMAKGLKKRAAGVLKGALAFALAAGLLSGALIWIFSDLLTGVVLKTPLAGTALRIMAPLLLVMAVISVFRGFFQGMGEMVPVVVSQILEQIATAIVSIWAAYVLYRYGLKVGAVLGDKTSYTAAWGAGGGACGLAAGLAAALLVLLIMLAIFLSRFKKEMAADQSKKTDSVSYLMKTLGKGIAPLMLSVAVFNFAGLFNQGFFKNVAMLQGYEESQFGLWWGVFSGKYQMLVSIPLAIAGAAAAQVLPLIGQAHAAKNNEEEKRLTGAFLQYAMIVAFPFAAEMGVLAKPLFGLLFPTTLDTLAEASCMMWIGFLAIVFYSAAIITNAVLQGINHMKIPVRNAAIALGVQTLVLIMLMLFLRLNIYAVVISGMIFAFLVSLLNMFAIAKYMGYRPDWVKIFLKPAASALVMGVVSFGIYFVLQLFCPLAAAFAAALAAGLIIYPVALALLKGVSEEELRQFPQGSFWADLAKKVHFV